MNGLTGQTVERINPLQIDEEALRMLYPEHAALEPSKDDLFSDWRAAWEQTQNAPIKVTIFKQHCLSGRRVLSRHYWSQAELDTLRRVYPAHGAVAVLEALKLESPEGTTDRTKDAILKMVNKIGLYRI